MTKFGLIGNNISESLSPKLFNAAYDFREYEYHLLDSNDFDGLFTRFSESFRAVNITSPFKETAYEVMARLVSEGKASMSGVCLKSRSVNLICKTEEGLFAHNTDFSGVIMSIAEYLFPGITNEFLTEFGHDAPIKIHQFCKQNISKLYTESPQALIIGCGGAGRTAAVAVSEIGYRPAIVNRTHSKAVQLSESLPEYQIIPVPVTYFREAVRECDLIIYTPPVKIKEIDTLEEQDFKTEQNPSNSKIILEASYTRPSFDTKQLMTILKSGATYISGKNWLLNQAVAGYPIMTGRTPDLNAMIDALQGK